MSSTPQRGQGRQEPASCQSCRAKKLRCNRTQPCSNCTARGISCIFLVPPHKHRDTSAPGPSNAELLRRIERLEALISQPLVSAENHNASPSINSHQPRQLTESVASTGPVTGTIAERDHDSMYLENVGTTAQSTFHDGSTGLTFCVRSTCSILAGNLFPTELSSREERYGFGATNIIIPTYEITTLLRQNYEANLDPMCRILHMPSLRSLAESIYLQINQNEPVAPGQAALLLAVLALAAFFSPPLDTSEWAKTQDTSAGISKVLTKSALDVLDYSRRASSGTLEEIQAHIIMSFVTFHHDGYSPRGRFHMAVALSLCRDLGLHRIDADSGSTDMHLSPRSRVDREMRRRVFWYLASAEWLRASISGPQEGIYFIHPHQVCVRVPKDCDDDTILLYEDDCPSSRDRPSGMTYLLERIRLAHICREIADVLPRDASRLEQVPYDHIISLDQKLQNYLDSLPFYFKLDNSSRHRAKALEAINPNISLLRFCITRAAHSRRIKLHQRYLLRRSSDPLYAYSRQSCLESARIVMQFYDGLADHNNPFIVTARMGIAVHYMHLALVVLVMDLCFNRGAAEEAQVKAEVKLGLKMFENNTHLSLLAGSFLSSLQDILHKHNVYLTDTQVPVANETPRDPFQKDSHNTSHGSSNGHEQHLQDSPTAVDYSTTSDTYFDDFWQATVQSELNPDLAAWDSLFSALDTRPL